MRKVQSAPQLTLLSTSTVNSISRTSFDGNDRLPSTFITRPFSRGPCLPPGGGFRSRRLLVATRALPFGLMTPDVLGEFDALAQKMENEVVFESETNSVTFAANSCFAEFGTSPQEAPDLFFGSKENLTDREKSLAVCLATPFEGKPEMLTRIKPRLLVAFSRDQSELCASELERKHLRRLLSYQQRKKCLEESTLDRLCEKNASLFQFIVVLFWHNALQSVYNRRSSLPVSLLEKITLFV